MSAMNLESENSSQEYMSYAEALKNMAAIEKGIYNSLDLLCQVNPVGNWLIQIIGIGPVLAAGLLAYLDVTDKHYDRK